MKVNLSELKQDIRNKCSLLVIIIVLFLFACKEKKTINFIYLEKVSTDPVRITKRSMTGHYMESILVEHVPKERKVLDSLIVKFFYDNRLSFCSLNLSFDKYSISFYEKTPCTSFFIENKQDKRHEIEGDRGCENDLAMFYYNRSKENPHIWYATYPDNFKDTVYCDSLIIAPPFED